MQDEFTCAGLPRWADATTLRTCDQLAGIASLGRQTFEGDLRTRWAIEMGFIRVGEEVSRLPESVRERYPDQPWRIIIAMRSMAAHQHGDPTPGRVWKALTDRGSAELSVARVMNVLADLR